MPALLGEYDAVAFIHIDAGEQLAGTHERRPVHLLPVLVQLLEIAGDGVGVVFVVSQEKVDAA